jgi:hypothetical protein
VKQQEQEADETYPWPPKADGGAFLGFSSPVLHHA